MRSCEAVMEFVDLYDGFKTSMRFNGIVGVELTLVHVKGAVHSFFLTCGSTRVRIADIRTLSEEERFQAELVWDYPIQMVLVHAAMEQLEKPSAYVKSVGTEYVNLYYIESIME